MSAIACHGSRRAPGLEIYLGDIDGTGLLSRREECELAARIADGDAAARDQLVRANLRLVVHLARGYRGRGLDMDDLVAEGNLGLIRAAEGYDGRMGVRFSTYASYWIKQSMQAALVNRGATIRLPAHAAQLLRRWHRASVALERSLGREPSFDEVAGAMGLPEGKRRIVEQALRTRRCSAPCEMPIEVPVTSAELEHAERGEELRARLGRLSPTERSIVALRHGLDGGEPMTWKEVGERFGYTREWARRIEVRALLKLR
jgi:RNA polymerase primary sigma factor